MNSRLQREIQLLYRCGDKFGIASLPIIRQLVEDEARPLPDTFPPLPQLVRFEWPVTASVDFVGYWREIDRRIR